MNHDYVGIFAATLTINYVQYNCGDPKRIQRYAENKH